MVALSIVLNGRSMAIERQNKYITLRVHYLQGKPRDSLTLTIGNKLIPTLFITKSDVYYATRDEKGAYQFKVPVRTNDGYFTLTAKRTYSYKGFASKDMFIIYPQYWERGDNLEIEISHKETAGGIQSLCKFKGIGSDKYKARYAIQQEEFAMTRPDFNGNILKYPDFDRPNKSHFNRLLKLDKYKNRLSDLAYNVLKAETYYYGNSFYSIQEYYKKLLQEKKLDSAEQFRVSFNQKFSSDTNYRISSRGKENSSEYLDYSYRKLRCKALLQDTLFSTDTLFGILLNGSIGQAKESLLLRYFKTEETSKNNLAQFEIAQKLSSNLEYLLSLKELEITLPRRIISDYTLINLEGTKINLSDFDNKIVLIDFWFTGCGGCQSLYKNVLSTVEERYKHNPNIVFISISIDYSFQKWANSVKEGNYTSMNAVNLYTEGLGLNHPIVKDNRIWAYPTLLLLAKNRRLHLYNSEVLHKYETLVREIESLL